MSANVNTIDAKMFQKMFLAGAQNLEAKKEWINDLNVFPVPDGAGLLPARNDCRLRNGSDKSAG